MRGVCKPTSQPRSLVHSLTQVRKLAAALGPAARVGTVDRFQGQEAAVVIVSLCHSEFDDAVDDGLDAGGGRGLSFVLNRNRLNVALSRAQCLAVVVGSPRLTEASARSLQQQRELNFVCAISEAGDGATQADSPPVALVEGLHLGEPT